MKELVKSGGRAVDLASAFDASPNPYVLLTPDLRIAGLNQAYLDVTNSTRAAIIGRSLFSVFDSGPGEDAPENVRKVRESLERARDMRQRDHLPLVKFHIARLDGRGERLFEERYWSATHTPMLDEAGEVAFILQHTTDITELHRLRERSVAPEDAAALSVMLGGAVLGRAEQVQEDNRRLEGERNRLMDMFMQAPGFVAVLSGPNHVLQMYNAAYAQLIGHREAAGKPIREALPEVDPRYYDALDEVYSTGEPYLGNASLVQLQRTAGGPLESVYADFVCQPIRDGAGVIVGIFIQGHDVTGAVQAAERQRLMIDELNHRVKNTLATVQSIAVQTARSHANPRTFAEGFQARLLALSHTHDLLTRSHWEGADLGDILQHETKAHGSHRVSVNGPRVALPPAAALSLGMVFHELATNAAKYGALSAADGRILVDWSLANQNHPRLQLIWREVGGPAVVPPARRGFGSRLIERNVRHDLAGEVELDYPHDGLVATFSIPLDREQVT